MRRFVHPAALGLLGLLLWTSTAAAAAAPARVPSDPRVFYLLPRDPADSPLSILGCEIERQAVLMTARHGLGMETRDGSLREWEGAPTGGVVWSLRATRTAVQLLNEKKEVVWEEDLSGDPNWFERIDRLIAKTEFDSRSKFYALFLDHGFKGTPDLLPAKGKAPDDVEDQLARLNELSQFAVVRELHQLIHEGETQERLGPLIRAYANLGQLTRWHWSAEHQVFTARSLLYAQRMVVHNHGIPTAISLRYRAYAMALAGWQGRALKDLDAARAIDHDAQLPSWTPLIENFCKCDVKQLSDPVVTKDQAPLAAFLAFLAVERSGCVAQTLKFADPALQSNPSCLRLIDGMCNVAGPGPLNELVGRAPGMFSDQLALELPRMPGLPQPVLDLAAGMKQDHDDNGRAQVCQALMEQGAADKDSAEPSWAVLGRLIEETHFTQDVREAHFLAVRMGVSAKTFAAQEQPIIARHPFKSVIDTYGDLREAPQEAQRSLAQVPVNLLAVNALPFCSAVADLKAATPQEHGAMMAAVVGNLDYCSFDQEALVAFHTYDFHFTDLDYCIEGLTKLNPYSPLPVCSQLENDWNNLKLSEIEANYGQHPLVLQLLGAGYRIRGKTENARRCLNNLVEQWPAVSTYSELADLYFSQTDDTEWLRVLEECLQKTQPTGLDHAQLRVRIAQCFMYRKKYPQAVKFAEDAAATGASWALQCAAVANTAAGNFDRAEQLVKEDGEHYSRSPYVWYKWCIQTGHGRRKEAFEAVNQYLSDKGDDANAQTLVEAAFANAAEGNAAEAIALFKRRMKQLPGPLSLANLIVFADEAGDAATRDDALRQATLLQNGEPHILAFLKVLAGAYAPGAKLDLKAVDESLKRATPTASLPICLLTAQCLLDHGDKEAATGYLRKCYFGYGYEAAQDPLVYKLSRDVGIDPMAVLFPATTQPSK